LKPAGTYREKKMDRWNPDSYLQYASERTQPSRDLVARIAKENPHTIIDIGCGPGNSTRILRGRWPDAEIAGLDSSAEMIAKARANDPARQWILADAESWSPGSRYDIVFSNAALQWMPQQEAVIPRLFEHLEDDGVLAVQVPMNNDSPLYQAMIAVSERDEWHLRLQGCGARPAYKDESFYYDLLTRLTSRVEIWLTTYLHRMNSRRDLIDWYASTGLRPYLAAIDTDAERERFKQEILATCEKDYPIRRDGKVLFPFRRLFFLAWKDREENIITVSD
jgi:trans-aconitate 2-methyltransferase